MRVSFSLITLLISFQTVRLASSAVLPAQVSFATKEKRSLTGQDLRARHNQHQDTSAHVHADNSDVSAGRNSHSGSHRTNPSVAVSSKRFLNLDAQAQAGLAIGSQDNTLINAAVVADVDVNLKRSLDMAAVLQERGLLDGLLGAVFGIIDLVSPTIGDLLGKVLGSLVLAQDVNSMNEFEISASSSTKSNVYLTPEPSVAPLSDGSQVVTLKVPVYDEADSTMQAYCAQFNSEETASSPLVAAPCVQGVDSQFFAYHPLSGLLRPLRIVQELLANGDSETSTETASSTTSDPLTTPTGEPALAERDCDQPMGAQSASSSSTRSVELRFTPIIPPGVAIIKSQGQESGADEGSDGLPVGDGELDGGESDTTEGEGSGEEVPLVDGPDAAPMQAASLFDVVEQPSAPYIWMFRPDGTPIVIDKAAV